MSVPTPVQRVADDEDEVPTRLIALRVNGTEHRVRIEDRQLLVEVLRGQLGLKGTRVGCYNGDCGACTVEVGGRIAKSCMLLAASVDGAEVTTLEGFSGMDAGLDPIQQAFWDHDAFQCGFCVAGHLFAARALLAANPDPTDDEIRAALVGNLCRCTGYVNLVTAIRDAAGRLSVSPGA